MFGTAAKRSEIMPVVPGDTIHAVAIHLALYGTRERFGRIDVPPESPTSESVQ